MNKLSLVLLCCIPLFLFGQKVDSTVIMQVNSLLRDSEDFTEQGNFEKAFEVNEKAKKMALDKLGKESAKFVDASNWEGAIHLRAGNFPAAEKWILEAKSIFEKKGLEEYPGYSKTLNNLSVLYKGLGDYEKAISIGYETLALMEKIQGKNNPDYAGSLVNQGMFFMNKGDYEKAEEFYLQAKNIFEVELGDQKHQN